MEFLLINHPLDCPICDQGGECELQDLAMGFGRDVSRFGERKRVVKDKNLGPLVSTDMTRCIHCTRCVRFGQEIAGVKELGTIGRGEHSEIVTFVGTDGGSRAVRQHHRPVPGGCAQLQAVPLLARAWEMARRSIAPHDGLGSNLVVQVKLDKVLRVVPMENDAVNECWVSDKDRFSYEGLNRPTGRRAP